jgi:hypothetical protein
VKVDGSRDLGLTMVLPFYMAFMGLFIKNNPLCPAIMYEWIGRAFFIVLDPIVNYLGGCMAHCHSSTGKLEPATDKTVIAKGGDFSVTTFCGQSAGAFKTLNQCTAIRSQDALIFYNPVMVDPAEYKKFDEPGVKRVQIVLGNAFHHMAVDRILDAFPDAQVTGSVGASFRHPSIKARFVKPQDAWALPGCELIQCAIPVYFECWLYFEPAKLLCLCDVMPHITSVGIEEGGFCLIEGPLKLSSCADSLTCCKSSLHGTCMGGYTMTTCADQKTMARIVTDMLSNYDIQMATGAHKSCKHVGDHENTHSREDVLSLFAWLLPKGFEAKKDAADTEMGLADGTTVSKAAVIPLPSTPVEA